MNSLIVKLFVFLTEALSGIIIGIVVLLGIFLMAKVNLFAGLFVAVCGALLVVAIFGLAVIAIEIHRDVRAVKQISEKIMSATQALKFDARAKERGDVNFTSKADQILGDGPHQKRLMQISDSEKSLDKDVYKVYLVEKYEIRINEVLNKYFFDGALYDTVDLALARAHELEMGASNVSGELIKQKAIQNLEKRGFKVLSVEGGWRVVGDGIAFDFQSDDEMIDYSKLAKE